MNGVTATYDALGRMVETGSGSSYQQFVFRPSGALLAIYNAGTSTLVKGTVQLPGGDTAIYNSSGLGYLRHTDWLGSSRLATTWAHAVYSKEAYAPFGETYNEAGMADRSFTGQDQDVVTGSGGTGAYDFLYRKHDPSAGRWLSPDPAGWGAVDLSNPQTLDRYAYVGDQPMNSFDPNGEWWCFAGISTEGGYDLTQGGYTYYDDGFGSSVINNPGGGMVAQNGMIYAPVSWDSNGNPNVYTAAGVYWYESGNNYVQPQNNPAYCTLNSCPGAAQGPANVSAYNSFKSWLHDMKACVVDVGAATALDDLNPIPTLSGTGLLGSAQSAADSFSNAAFMGDAAHSVQNGLTVPLRSSIVRGGIATSETLGKLSGILTMANVVYALGDAVNAELNAKECY